MLLVAQHIVLNDILAAPVGQVSVQIQEQIPIDSNSPTVSAR